MIGAKKLWTTRVVGSKVLRIDPDVFRVLQRIAIESGLQSSTPAQVLRKIFEDNDLMGGHHGQGEIRQDANVVPGDVQGGGQRDADHAG